MIVELGELSRIRDQNQDRVITFAGGVFDILHAGHIEFLEYVKSLGDIAVIAVSCDARVRERKGPHRPINNEQARLVAIDSRRKYVDYSLIAPPRLTSDAVPTIQMMEQLRPNYFISSDPRWHSFENNIRRCGAEFILDLTPKITSTTEIVEKVLRNYNAVAEGP